jgi:hypothetical protein
LTKVFQIRSHSLIAFASFAVKALARDPRSSALIRGKASVFPITRDHPITAITRFSSG